jgi:hypothetical protein
MEPLIQATVLAAATVLATGAAIALNWVLLQSAFRLMQPAARPVRVARLGLAEGTRAMLRGLGGAEGGRKCDSPLRHRDAERNEEEECD